MYCDKCKKQSPDNFENCAYCGAKLKNEKPKKKPVITYGEGFRFFSTENAVISLIAASFLITVICCIVGLATGSKPDSVLKTMLKSIKNNDVKGYYAIFDSNIKSFKKEYFYFSDDALLEGMTSPMKESNSFYTETCGNDFRLKYSVKSLRYLENDEMETLNEKLSELYGYTDKASKAVVIDFDVNAKGGRDSYVSAYRNFVCIKISGKWYKAPESYDILFAGTEKARF